MDHPNIFSFIRSSKANEFSPEKLEYQVAVLGIDGTMLHEANALTVDDAKAKGGMKDNRLDAIFDTHFPPPLGWKIKWCNGTSDKQMKDALELFSKKSGTDASGQQPVTGEPGKQDEQKAGEPVVDDNQKPAEKEKQRTKRQKKEKTTDVQAVENTDTKVYVEKPEIVSINLPKPLDMTERADIADDLIDCLREVSDLEGERKSANEKFKGKIAELEEHMQEIRKRYEHGDMEGVPCEVYRTPDGKIEKVIRSDTKEVVDQDDWQPTLGLGLPKDKPPADSESPDRFLTMLSAEGKLYLTDVWDADGWTAKHPDEIVKETVFRRMQGGQSGPLMPVFDEKENAIFKALAPMKNPDEKGGASILCVPWALETA